MGQFSESFYARAIALQLLLVLVLTGCDQLQTDSNTAKANTTPQARREHHFDPIARSEGNLAVDTTTGQMCRTWEWVCADGDTFYNRYTKKYQDKMNDGISCSAIRDMPTCESISRQ